nr:EAL domain-containing protein [Vibrio amylolyticus]
MDYIQSLLRYQGDESVYGHYRQESFYSAFQPIVDHSGELFAFEGLVRIYNQQGELKNTGDYFDRLKPGSKANVIVTLLCAKLHTMNLAHSRYRTTKLFINVAPSVFTLLANHHQAIEQLMYRLECLKIQSSQIIYEITEFDQSEMEGILRGQQRLAEYGILTALDDYGTRYSTYERAMQIKAPYLKIDRSFVSNKRFVRSAVEVAQSIGAKTIAEGVETQQQYQLCKEYGVDFFQGYWLQRPMTTQRLSQYRGKALELEGHVLGT